MTADTIQANYEHLATIAARFGRSTEATEELERRVRERFAPLEEGGWVGRGADAFCAEMHDKIFPGLQRLSHVLREAQAVTLALSDTLQQAEQEAAKLFDGRGGGLSSGGSASGGPGRGGAAANGSGTDNSSLGQILGQFWSRHGEAVHDVLGWLGVIPHPIGEAANLVDAAIYAIEGRPIEAAIALLPMPGSSAVNKKVAGWLKEVGSTRIGKYADQAGELGANIYNKLVGDGLGKLKSVHISGGLEVGTSFQTSDGQNRTTKIGGSFDLNALRLAYADDAGGPRSDGVAVSGTLRSWQSASASGGGGGSNALGIDRAGWEGMKQTWGSAMSSGQSVSAGIELRFVPKGDYKPVCIGVPYSIGDSTYRGTLRTNTGAGQ